MLGRVIGMLETVLVVLICVVLVVVALGVLLHW